MSEIKTTEQLIEEIKRLPEIELDSLLKEIASHLHRQKLSHLVEQNFELDLTDEVETLREENEEFSHTIDLLRADKNNLQSTINKIKDLL